MSGSPLGSSCPVGCPVYPYPTLSYRSRHFRRGTTPCDSAKLCRQRHERRLRVSLAVEQQWNCPLCQQPLPYELRGLAHVDHIVPKSRGGSDARDNLQTVHAACNRIKGTLTPAEQAVLRRLAKRLRLPHRKGMVIYVEDLEDEAQGEAV